MHFNIFNVSYKNKVVACAEEYYSMYIVIDALFTHSM